MKKKTENILKILFEIIYGVGVICVLIFGVTYLKHSTEIPYPAAMLPMMKYEIAAWRLIIGAPLMIASCISIILINKIRKVIQRLLILLPAIICMVIGLSYFITSV